MRKTVITAALLTLAIVSPAGAADPSTGVTTLNATVGTNVAVSGVATFVDVPVTVGTDADGDATPGAIGADVRKLTIARPSGNNLKFTMEIDDFYTGVPVPNIVYLWPLMVNGEDTQLFLMAGAGRGFPSPSADPGFAVMQNSADGFAPVADVSGTLGNGGVTWTVPMGSIAGKAGDNIDQGSGAPASTRAGIHQIVWLESPQYDSFTVREPYTIPGNLVELGIAPAGTPEDAVPLTVKATVNNTTGAFSGSLPKQATPGEYVVVAKACFGPQSCGLSSTTITVV